MIKNNFYTILVFCCCQVIIVFSKSLYIVGILGDKQVYSASIWNKDDVVLIYFHALQSLALIYVESIWVEKLIGKLLHLFS